MDVRTHRIVVGYDGSDPSRSAVHWAAREAVRRGAELIVLYVVDHGGLAFGAAPHGLTDQWPMIALTNGRGVATDGAALAATAAPGVLAHPHAQTGPVTARLIDAAGDADLLVVGSRSRNELAAACLGSVSAVVAAHARCPVVVVRGEHLHSPGPQRRVVVGTDGSPQNRAAVRFAADVAASAGAPLVVICAWDPSTVDSWMLAFGDATSPEHHELVEWARRTARTALDEATAEARARHPELHVVPEIHRGEASWALTKAARDAGLLVVGTRGRGGFASLLLGSVSRALIRGASCPVAVVRPDQVVLPDAAPERPSAALRPAAEPAAGAR